MLKIKDLYDYDACSSFMIEFIGYMERSKVEQINFEEFMEVMYGSISDFKKYYLSDMKKSFESITYYLGKYKKIVDLLESE